MQKEAESPSQNVTINLISLMVKRGLITKDDAEGLIRQAEQEAAAARTQTAATASNEPSPAVPANPEDDDVRVNYVPDVVKNEIREDVKADVLKQARKEHWARDDSIPDWVHRFHVTGDIRVRVEGDYFPAGNDDTGAFTNFNSINTGSPFDTSAISNPRFPPEYNVDQDRYRPRIRARIGAGIDLNDNFTAGMRVGTGQDNTPTTQNQTLGLANNGQGGDFSKYAVWLDRAFIRYEISHPNQEDVTISLGRFDNPFMSSTMIWASEIGFDGIAAKGSYQAAPGVKPFLTAGFFPVFNTDFNFASNQPAKFSSEDKWLTAAQAGVGLADRQGLHRHRRGRPLLLPERRREALRSVHAALHRRPGRHRRHAALLRPDGNTYREIRDIAPTAANNFGTIDQFQYYGLATGFHDVAITGQLDYSRFDPFHLQLAGEFVENLAFDRGDIDTVAVNNRGGGGAGTFAGGNKGYNVSLTMGQPVLQKLWDWNLSLTYRYVESDATHRRLHRRRLRRPSRRHQSQGLHRRRFGGPFAAHLRLAPLHERRCHRGAHLPQRSLPIRHQRQILAMNRTHLLLSLFLAVLAGARADDNAGATFQSRMRDTLRTTMQQLNEAPDSGRHPPGRAGSE